MRIGLPAAALLLLAFALPAHADHRTVRLPDVVGHDADEAVQLLEDLGVVPRLVEVAGVPAGRVAEQNPPGGSQVPRESDVEIRVGVLVRIETRVPDVIGWPADRAVRALEGAYLLEVEEVPGAPGTDGEVLETVPATNARLAFRGTLVLRVSVVPQLAVVPRVTGLLYADAERYLVGLGFAPVPRMVEARGAAPGTVVRQDPPPGSQVEVGAAVQVQVATPPRPAPQVRVPSLLGLDEAQASQVLTELGLRRAVEHAPTPFSPGRVFRQAPDPGTLVPPGTQIQVWVGSRRPHGWRPRQVVVPSVVGNDPATARMRLASEGLDAALANADAPGRPLDVVFEQVPPAGTRVPSGTRIELRVPLGVEVPQVVGMEPEAAQQVLSAAGLVARLEGTGRSPGRRRPVVAAQEPAPGTRVARSTPVRLVISENPGSRSSVVPELVGRTVEDAEAILAQSGFVGRFDGPPRGPGAPTRITAQDPAPGVRAPAGSEVRATFALVRPGGPPAPARTVVPDLSGRTVEQARHLLQAAGLTARLVGPDVGVGTTVVVGQDPAPGSLVARASEVRVRYVWRFP